MRLVNYFKKFYWKWHLRYCIYTSSLAVERVEKAIKKELMKDGNSKK
jgi:hypothetical protein